MAKSKTPSPQEVYRARRAREEKERLALLPPGLFNHGNTCFMNSVLQGLIATRYLQLLVQFQPVPPPIQRPALASRRSPVLTNGHGLAGEHDQPWSDALPIGDIAVSFLRTAWDIQNNRRRENISPKDVLAELGKKYDQYLDFRQQDAHEFLCQLLDAVRMEEMDVIKQRLPPQKKQPRRARSRHQPADDELISSVDMLFGGKLASILVCQACKHVSHTYEDFTDLSLSIKPEDYVRERKRDKLKQFAKKIGTAFSAVPQQRSSSVPATPIRDSNLDGPEPTPSQRRRSIDLADVERASEPLPVPGDVTTDTAPQPSPSPIVDSLPQTPIDSHHHLVPITDTTASVPQDSSDHIPTTGKDRRDKDESWAKLSRRITVSVGLAMRPRSERKDRKPTPSVTPSKPSDDPLSTDPTTDTPSPLHPEREPTSLGVVNDKLQTHLANVKKSVLPSQRSGNSPSASSASRFPLISRPASPGVHPKSSKPPRPPKLSTEEAAYLRDILADINPPGVPKPFSIFRHSKEPPTVSTFHSHSIFLKVNQINRIEECLRLFTSVEVLNGDNTVRCHRCWKIANGLYQPRARESAQEPDSCSDSEDDEPDDATKPNDAHSSPDSISPHPAHGASPSCSTTSLPDTQTSRDTPSSLTRSSPTTRHVPPALQLNDHDPIELVSPVSNEPLTATRPAVSESPKTAKPPPVRRNTGQTHTSTTMTERSSGTSLSAPSDPHQHGSESEISEAESETMLSVYSDVSSSNVSPDGSQDHFAPPLPDAPKDKTASSGVPRSRQYLLRPAYKRYLIATPPPVLVVHLKRFQQLTKAPVVSFATGFKKLDDYIAFPELLDLAPYLAPRREDYFDSKVAIARGRARRPAPCMYRLYAVVVHIGNMLGGHYVAYTALPPTPPGEGDTGDKTRGENGTRDWAFISDTIVRLATLDEVLKSKAYICMYERI